MSVPRSFPPLSVGRWQWHADGKCSAFMGVVQICIALFAKSAICIQLMKRTCRHKVSDEKHAGFSLSIPCILNP
ncbi:Zinc finger BED domain-containing protein DAYSLEEPER [Zea mays]|uniref:Zinc finger BED domain-containing protein DAYSLEEPER n=1 Tax=Zea mays TaxID=4577 RepID=A0A1D6HIA0_MAIZE|nr:Zinc finger BED domain-containing protein DAYSLEEPER [Zea mays]